MITLVITNRNRDLRIVKNCLESLHNQLNHDFKCFLVDYGSNETYYKNLLELVKEYERIQFVSYPVSGQLWNKSRAINTILKTCDTPYFFVGDIDMIFSKDFISTLYELQSPNKITYFQVGFLSQQESLAIKKFEAYPIAFLSNKEATGMTLYPTQLLKSINGYDEFYHGWGAEDTDVHIRLKNSGIPVIFYEENVVMKHQWHPKQYRSTASIEPYHSSLEKINHSYIKFVEEKKIKQANRVFDYGKIPVQEEYEKLNDIEETIHITNEKNDLTAFLEGNIFNLESKTYKIIFSSHSLYGSLKNTIKKKLGKKALSFYSLDEVNNRVLMTLIKSFRNNPYYFEYKKSENKIILKILL